ncbi:MAG: hypothetical protein ABW221_05895, partial [Vicinamibacteria bacterium]
MPRPAFVLGLALLAATAHADIRLEPDGHFAEPGFALLVYHNRYIVGRAGGVQLILHGRRVLDAGQVVVRGRDGKTYGGDAVKVGERTVANGAATVKGRIEALAIGYTLDARTDGRAVTLTVTLDAPVDWTKVERAGFELELFPEQFWHKAYFGGGRSGLFHERNAGAVVFVPDAAEIAVAPDDPLTSLVFAAEGARLRLADQRNADHVQGFTLRASLPEGSTARTFALRITPKVDAAWRKPNVLRASQAGYRPEQRKQAVLEMDPRDEPGPVRLERVLPDGTRRPVREAKPVRFGPVFDSTAYTFDFTD